VQVKFLIFTFLTILVIIVILAP